MSVTPHVIRRTRAMHLLEAGVNLIYIRDLLGHADVSTTEIYARADAEAKRKAIESAYQSLTPDRCLTGQQTKTSSTGSTKPVGDTRVMWPEQARGVPASESSLPAT